MKAGLGDAVIARGEADLYEQRSYSPNSQSGLLWVEQGYEVLTPDGRVVFSSETTETLGRIRPAIPSFDTNNESLTEADAQRPRAMPLPGEPSSELFHLGWAETPQMVNANGAAMLPQDGNVFLILEIQVLPQLNWRKLTLHSSPEHAYQVRYISDYQGRIRTAEELDVNPDSTIPPGGGLLVFELPKTHVENGLSVLLNDKPLARLTRQNRNVSLAMSLRAATWTNRCWTHLIPPPQIRIPRASPLVN